MEGPHKKKKETGDINKSLLIHDNYHPLPGFEPHTGHWSEYEADSIPMCNRASVIKGGLYLGVKMKNDYKKRKEHAFFIIQHKPTYFWLL